MGQEECEQYVLDKNESEDYYYLKEVKKNPEPAFGSCYALFHYGGHGLCCRRGRCVLV